MHEPIPFAFLLRLVVAVCIYVCVHMCMHTYVPVYGAYGDQRPVLGFVPHAIYHVA